MKSFKQHLTESISIRRIEDQLRTHFLSYRKTNPMSDEMDFKFAIEGIVRRATSLFLDNISLDFAVVNIVENHINGNSGSFAFIPNVPRVHFEFSFDKEVVRKIIEEEDRRSLNKVIQIISHEFLHAIQFDRAKTKSSPKDKKYKKYNGDTQYHGSQEEIEAYAANAAQELEQDSNINLEQILKSLRSSSKYPQTKILEYLSSQSDAFRRYYLRFGNSNDYKLKRIFKRFIKKFIYHINDRI